MLQEFIDAIHHLVEVEKNNGDWFLMAKAVSDLCYKYPCLYKTQHYLWFERYVYAKGY